MGYIIHNDDFLYQVGDIVKVRDDLSIYKRYGMQYNEDDDTNVVYDMLEFAGKYVEIQECYRDFGHIGYYIKDDSNHRKWKDDMFDIIPALPNPDNCWEDFFLN